MLYGLEELKESLSFFFFFVSDSSVAPKIHFFSSCFSTYVLHFPYLSFAIFKLNFLRFQKNISSQDTNFGENQCSSIQKCCICYTSSLKIQPFYLNFIYKWKPVLSHSLHLFVAEYLFYPIQFYPLPLAYFSCPVTPETSEILYENLINGEQSSSQVASGFKSFQIFWMEVCFVEY